MKTTSRNCCIDTIKGFACIAVVLIHYNWGNTFSTLIQVVGRFAVPFFFFVAGFYLPDHNSNITPAKVLQKIKHICILLSKSILFYSLFCILWNLAMDSNWNLAAFVQEKITADAILKLILSSDPIVYGHLWYLLATMSCYVLLFFICRLLNRCGSFFLFIVLAALYILFAEFRAIFGIRNSYPLPGGKALIISNLFFLRALPFVVYGIFLRKMNTMHCRLPVSVLLAICLLGFLCAMIEHYYYGTILMYVGTFISVIAMSLIARSYPEKRIAVMEYIGSRLSVYVYIDHIAVGKTIDLIYTKLHLWGNTPWKLLRPILALLSSLAVAQIIVFCKQKMTVKKNCR